MRVNFVHNKPGTNIRQLLSNFSISDNGGCGCEALANRMNEAGSEEVKANLDSYVDEMIISIKRWRKNNITIVPTPPRFIIKSLILWACHSSQ